MVAPAVVAALKAAGSALGKAALRGAAVSAAKKSKNGGGFFVILAIAAAIITVVFGAPAFLVGTALVVTTAMGDSTWGSDDGGADEEPSGPTAWDVQRWSTVPACVAVRPAEDVDGSLETTEWDSTQLENAQIIIEAALKVASRGGWEDLPESGETWPEAEEPVIFYGDIEAALVASMVDTELHLRAVAEDDDGVRRGGLFNNPIDDEWGDRSQVVDREFSTGTFLNRLDWRGYDTEGVPTRDPWVAIREAQAFSEDFNNTDDLDHDCHPDIDNSGVEYQPLWDSGDAKELLSRFLDGSGCGVLPIDAPYYISSGYGARDLPIEGSSKWHPAWDFYNDGGCDVPIYAVRPGTVEMIGGGQANNMGILDPVSGAQVQYLHTEPGQELVAVGDVVELGQHIANVSNYGVGSGCHLDLRIYAPRVPGEPRITDGLEHTEDISTEPLAGYVHPAEFMALFGVELCAPDECTAQDELGTKY